MKLPIFQTIEHLIVTGIYIAFFLFFVRLVWAFGIYVEKNGL